VNLNDFYNEVSRRVDTDKTKINVAETKRVLSEAFKLLAEQDAASCADVIAKGLATAKKKKSS
jgi:hypothetical protein